MNLKTKDIIASTIVSSIFLLLVVLIFILIGYFFGYMSIVFGFAAVKFYEFALYIKNTISAIYRM